MADGAQLSDSEKKKEDWMNSKWRPMMGWMYMIVCTMDMVVFPILWSILQAVTHTQITQWDPLTLRGAGLFHIAMGAVLGLAAWGRTQEKLNGANNGGASTPTTSGFGVPSSGPSSFSTPTQAGFGSASTSGGFGSGSTGSIPSTTNSGFSGGSGFGSGSTQGSTTQDVTVTVGFGGKPAPAQPAFPAI